MWHKSVPTLRCARLLLYLLVAQVVRAERPPVVYLEFVGQPPEAKVAARIIATRKSHEKVERVFEVSDRATLTLEPGSWTLVATAPGFWSPQTSLSVTVPETRVRLKLWPVGALDGNLRGPPGEGLPASFELLFRSPPDVERSRSIPHGQVSCPVDETAWRCEVPAGVIDLQMVAAGFIRRFRWDVRVKAGETTRLGNVKLQRGSDVIGWVVAEDGNSLEGARIELLKSAAVRPHDPEARSRVEDQKRAATVNHRGFFQLDAVTPGDYVLTASREPLTSARVTVRVLADKTTEVADPPLTLRLPRTLELYVDPPSPPGMDHWVAKLLQADSHGNVMGSFAEGVIPPDGTWKVEPIALGTYYLSIATANGDRWHQQSLEIEANALPVFITIPSVELRGSVRLGEDPVSAGLVFGGRYGAQNVSFFTNEDGKFSGLLPREGHWEIDVEVDDPPITRSVQQEVVDGEDLEIVFPNTRVHGSVVDESGHGVGGAIVRITNLGNPQMAANPKTDEKGRFEIFGLPAGRTVFMAELGDRYSQPQEVLVEEKLRIPEIRLVLSKMLELSGRVVSGSGGVPGAKISTMSVEVPFWGSPISGSDAEGRFELALPAATRQVILNVAAPGFAFRTLRIDAEEPLVVPVEAQSGSLVLELPESFDPARWSSETVAIFHGAGSVALSQLIAWAGFHGIVPDSEHLFLIPFMEPGDYSVCLVEVAAAPTILAGDRSGVFCTSGSLPAFGELKLKLHETR